MNPVTDFARLELRDEVPWLILSGAIEYGVADRVSDAELSEYRTAGELHVDASHVTFIDSIGVSLLLRLRHVSESVVLHDAGASLLRTLELTGVQQLFVLKSSGR